MPEALTVFLAPPSWEALESRLTGRGTETPEAMNRRLATARAELAAQDDFDTRRREQSIGVCLRRIGILAGGPSNRAGHGVTRPASYLKHFHQTARRPFS